VPRVEYEKLSVDRPRRAIGPVFPVDNRLHPGLGQGST
jgi:hypothetical protein